MSTTELTKNGHGFPMALPGAGAETLMWADPADVEPQALDQLRNISRLPWVHGVRVMPDVHLGKGATVGSVVAMRDAVSPAAVGVDIGCGMQAVRTSLTQDDLPDDLRPLRLDVERTIPVGFRAHKSAPDVRALGLDHGRFAGWKAFWKGFEDLHPGVKDRERKSMEQMGSLGGGNHFIELTTDESGQVWLMLHSGSRNIGKEIADRHIGEAKGLDHNLDLPDRDLAVFLAGSAQMDAYLRDLYWAQEYASRNRAVMMALFQAVVARAFAAQGLEVTFGEQISAHHNYVATETLSDGTELIVTRKGAIRAGAGEYGLIPGSMGTGSYVVKGHGSEASYWSASHGAGRKMSRNKAKRTFTVEDLAAQTAGVECRKDAGVVDEIPGAYKDLDAVVEAQSDLVEVVARLTTLMCVKG
ncbi:RtcB family protein [Nocardioides marmorisolisilvae]|uniref:3'-phosphate/5'-hydroxy nucleic acid ligase n=1 Tax=Nocardioides marmorisolisilvae TaxID=1542737 RepID=A0A3N0E0W0_9ACTN|nr:RtcB family protein [Nocardioides marmorisolisilvae]RNL81383.1 RtcB family protein [Nocardioides marmorisolisilvae]